MSKKHNKEYILGLIDSFELSDGYRLVVYEDFDYVNSSTRVELVDNLGYRYEKTCQLIINAINKGKRFSIVNRNKYVEENIRLFVELNCPDITFISYKQGKPNKVKYRCIKGHIGERDINYLFNLKNNVCSECNKRTITMELIISEFKERGYDVLVNKTIFKKSSTRVFYICPKHGEKNIIYDSFNSGCGCDECGRENVIKSNKYSYEEFKEEYELLNITKYRLLRAEEEFDNTRTRLSFVCNECNKIFKLGVHNILKNNIYCPHCEVFGENSSNWKGGITPIHIHLRGSIGKWKTDTEFNCGRKCVLTGDDKYDIHHTTSFNTILFETLSNLDLPIYLEISKYTENQLINLREECIRLHNKYGLGVCLSESVHKLLHKIYGYGDNTIKQWKQFESDFKSGKYKKGIDY